MNKIRKWTQAILSFGDVNNNVTRSIGKINEEADRLESDLAAAQATIEKQRKVIEWFAQLVHRRCLHCVNRGGNCEGATEAHCAAGVIAYAEKQVEEARDADK